MPDTNTPQRHSTGGSAVESWQNAFAALPLEAPPAGGWKTVATHLQARPRRWPTWLAMAAALALAIGLPLRWAWQSSDPPTASTELVASQPAHLADTPAQVALAPPRQHTDIPASDGPANGTIASQAIADQSTTPALSTNNPAEHPTAATGLHTNDRQSAIVDERTSTSEPSSALTAIATASSGAQSSGTQLSAKNQAELDQLHVESARLEALLALTRDERVSSASVALLGEHFDDQLGTIDTALMQPELTDRQRLGLWRERVSALRQLAAFASTQRVLAAYGQRDDARLAGIY